MEIEKTILSDCYVIHNSIFTDKRGYFFESFNSKTFKKLTGLNVNFVQDNQSKSSFGVLRGLHFQKGSSAQTKLVRVLEGEVLDVAVDLRKGSPTFFKYHSVLLTENNLQSFFIPEGFAHGFQSLTPDCEMLYLHSADYNQELEFGLNAIDPLLGVDWPEPIVERSVRDSGLKMITKDFQGIDLL